MPRTSSPSKRWRHRLVLGLGSVVLTLGVAEWALGRVVPSAVWSALYRTASDPRLGFELIPGADVEFEGITIKIPATRVRVSAQGLRGTDVVVPKPAGRKRLACVGDSVAFGWGVRETESYCAVLASTLGTDWEALNLGVPGYGAAQKLAQLELKALPLQPDLVLVQFDQNDRDPPDTQADDDSVWAWLVDHSAIARFVHIRLRQSAAGGEPEGESGKEGPVAPFDGEAEAHTAFEAMTALLRRRGVPLVVFMRVTEQETALVKRLVGLDVPVVDVGPALRGDARYGPAISPEALEIQGDGHPTAEGHRRIAAAVLPVLRQRL
ncbi:MAG: hypothetical protein IV100_18815 [Myxococcales bacterium]|nr:hypothetical protein [Myxococcales bacterium]